MSDSKTRRDFLKLAGAAAASSFAGQALASDSPFGIKKMEQGYENVLAEGKCGGGMPDHAKGKAKGMEGKCGEGKCGEGKCGGGMSERYERKNMEGKCGEGKCGGR
jgi:uncharacterized low-complexity protein